MRPVLSPITRRAWVARAYARDGAVRALKQKVVSGVILSRYNREDSFAHRYHHDGTGLIDHNYSTEQVEGFDRRKTNRPHISTSRQNRQVQKSRSSSIRIFVPLIIRNDSRRRPSCTYAVDSVAGGALRHSRTRRANALFSSSKNRSTFYESKIVMMTDSRHTCNSRIMVSRVLDIHEFRIIYHGLHTHMHEPCPCISGYRDARISYHCITDSIHAFMARIIVSHGL